MPITVLPRAVGTSSPQPRPVPAGRGRSRGVPAAPQSESARTGPLARLPMPISSSYEWQFRSACADGDLTVFFHPEGERGPARRQRDQAAAAICAPCPGGSPCRTHAMAVREPYGFWGGLSEADREELYLRSRGE
jgi:WhiB family transcriptional regulator, redox-sensing transcriptional regulator